MVFVKLLYFSIDSINHQLDPLCVIRPDILIKNLFFIKIKLKIPAVPIVIIIASVGSFI